MNSLRRLFFGPEKIRKRIYELTAADLQLTAVWEFCIDEEGEPGQDEATVRPRPDIVKIRKLDGSYTARTEFGFADRKRALGYLYASSEEELPAIQPVIITPLGQVMFWYGIMAPEEDRQVQALARLASVSDHPFPIRYSCTVPLDDIPLDGDLNGFYHYNRQHEIQVIKR